MLVVIFVVLALVALVVLWQAARARVATLAGEADVAWADLAGRLRQRHQLLREAADVTHPDDVAERRQLGILVGDLDRADTAPGAMAASRAESRLTGGTDLLLRLSLAAGEDAPGALGRLPEDLARADRQIDAAAVAYDARVRALAEAVSSFPGSMHADDREIGHRDRFPLPLSGSVPEAEPHALDDLFG